MTQSQKVAAIAKILRTKFIGLRPEGAVYIAHLILEALEKKNTLVEIKPSERK